MTKQSVSPFWKFQSSSEGRIKGKRKGIEYNRSKLELIAGENKYLHHIWKNFIDLNHSLREHLLR